MATPFKRGIRGVERGDDNEDRWEKKKTYWYGAGKGVTGIASPSATQPGFKPPSEDLGAYLPT